MLEQVNSSAEYLSKTAINNGSGVNAAGINKNATDKYADNNIFFEDQSKISEEAITLFEKEQDIQNFTNLIMESFDDTSVNTNIAELLETGAYEVTDEELSDSMFEDDELMNSLFEIEED